MHRPIVGLCGYARSGKDTLARALIDKGWARAAFADELKRDVERIVGKPASMWTDAEKELWRPVLVAYGAARRKQSASYWIDMLSISIRAHIAPGVPVVVTDVRYPNEAEWIEEHGGCVVYVSRANIGAANDEEGWSIPETRRLARHAVANDFEVFYGREQLLTAVRAHYGKGILDPAPNVQDVDATLRLSDD